MSKCAPFPFPLADRHDTRAGRQAGEKEIGKARDYREPVYLPPASCFILSFFLCFLLSCSPPPPVPVPAAAAAASFSAAAPTSFRFRLPSLAGVPASTAAEPAAAGADFEGVPEADFGWS